MYGRPQDDTDDIEMILEEAGEVTGLATDVFDGITVDTSLPETVPAATRVYSGPLGYPVRTEFVANDTFFELSEDRQLIAAVHEVLEGTQARYDLGEVMREEFDASDDLAELVSAYQRRQDRLREGMTQALTNALVPGGERSGRVFYPYETDVFEDILEGEDIDLVEDLDVEADIPVYDAGVSGSPRVYDAEPAVYSVPRAYDGLPAYADEEMYEDVLEDLELYDGPAGDYAGPAS